MDIFEHLSLIPFLILGMGIVRLLEGMGKIIHIQNHSNKNIKLYWVHGVLVSIVCFSIVLFWWNSFDFNATGRTPKNAWHIVEYTFYLLPCLVLYLLTEISVPRHLHEFEVFDFRDYYYANHREIYLLCTVHALLMTMHSYVFFNHSLGSLPTLLHLSVAAVTLPMVIWGNRWIHGLLVLAYFALSLAAFPTYLTL